MLSVLTVTARLFPFDFASQAARIDAKPACEPLRFASPTGPRNRAHV